MWKAIGAFVIGMVMQLSAAQADEVQTHLDLKLAELRTDNNLIGVGAAIMVEGEVIALSVDGQRQKNGEPLTKEDKWHLGSVTKSMTSVLIAALVDEGVLSFDKPLPEMLPQIEMHPGWQSVTLHHLLSHTSGLPANLPRRSQSIRTEDAIELKALREEWITNLLAAAPKSAAGEKQLYSNTGYLIAGFVASETTGIPFEQLMEQRLFAPLGLRSAGFGPPLGDQPWGHQNLFGFKTAKDPTGRADNTPLISAAGRAHMSLADFATYADLHLDGSNLVSSHALTQMQTPVLDNYGYGVIIVDADWTDGNVIWHNGTNTMWYALFMVLPEKESVMVFTSNDGDYRKAELAFSELAKDLVPYLEE